MVNQTATEQQIANIFYNIFQNENVSTDKLKEIKAVPVNVEHSQMNTVVILIPTEYMLKVMKRYAALMEELKTRGIFKNTEIFLIRNEQINKNNKREVLQDIAYPAILSAVSTEYINGGSVSINKALVKQYRNMVNDDRLAVFEKVYESLTHEPIKFILANAE